MCRFHFYWLLCQYVMYKPMVEKNNLTCLELRVLVGDNFVLL
jgi:hypothetical protein